jgi:Cu-Zn family superoxide dismutase
MLIRRQIVAFVTSASASIALLGCSSAPQTVYGKPSAAPAPLPTSAKPTPPPPAPRAGRTATATIRDLAGAQAGTVTFTDAYGGVIVAGNITGLGLGAHAIHIHEAGKCEAPFTTAGAHFNPTEKHHGFLNPDGAHLGDLPNIDTPAAGKLRFEFMLAGVSLRGENAIVDGDGGSIVIHGSRDNYHTDPSGDSGSRIACGVIVLK